MFVSLFSLRSAHKSIRLTSFLSVRCPGCAENVWFLSLSVSLFFKKKKMKNRPKWVSLRWWVRVVRHSHCKGWRKKIWLVFSNFYFSTFKRRMSGLRFSVEVECSGGEPRPAHPHTLSCWGIGMYRPHRMIPNITFASQLSDCVSCVSFWRRSREGGGGIEHALG